LPRSPLFGDGISLKPEDFRLLRDLFAARTGLGFGIDARFTLERRLRERLAVLNLMSFSEYYHYLRFNPHADAEWEEAIDLLTTNETYFFREQHQLRAFRDEILPMLEELNRGRRRLAVWSAGCSTGEEAYTIAILVDQSGLFRRGASPAEPAQGLPPAKPAQNLPPAKPAQNLSPAKLAQNLRPSGEPPWDVRVYGSDISRRCVAAARRGVYGDGAFRTTPPEIRRAFFHNHPDGARIIEPIRQMCHFGQMNLLHEDRSRVIGRADAIFCRNVLIYFDAHARRQVIDTLYERLYPGGVLLLGHSESLLNVSTAFELLHLKDDLVYRKPLGQFRSPSPLA
jgi:chemotaxis protein methyltransferase CheR